MEAALAKKSGNEMPVTVLPSGLTSKLLGRQAYDWPSIKHLAENGVPYREIARHFNGLDAPTISAKAHVEKWLTPSREAKMRKELAEKQQAALKKRGQVRDVAEIIEEIWIERQERVNEKTFSIVEAALDGVTEETARELISEAKDLKVIQDVARKATGQDARDAKELDSGPSIAIDIGLLRSAGIQNDPAVIDV